MESELNQEMCEDCKDKLATHHCDECNANSCETCIKDIHRRNIFRHRFIIEEYTHTTTSNPQYKRNKTNDSADEQYTRDQKNAFIIAEPAALYLGPKFHNITEIQADELMPVVSFVGPTGVGKSALARMLCKKGTDKPLASEPKSTESTSADIHAYIGSFPTRARPSTALLLDCEGTNGTAPVSLKAQLQKSALRGIDEFQASRRAFVNTAFPRLLYMASSVFCFVFVGSVKEQQTIVELISVYASQAAASTVGQLQLPILIVVFNKTTLQEGEWDINKASERLQDIEVFKHIPDRSAACKQYAVQVQALTELIATDIDKQKLLPKEMVMQNFSHALPELSRNPQAPINFMEIALHNRPLPRTYSEYLREFFQCVYEAERQRGTPQHSFDQAAEALSTRLLDSLVHHMTRNNIAIPLSLPPELQTIIRGLEETIQSYCPCIASRLFPEVGVVTCESSVGHHGNVHQSSKSYQETETKESFLQFLGSSTRTSMRACRWDGAIELHEKYHPMWLVANIRNAPVHRVDAVFFEHHKAVLDIQHELLCRLETTRICLACLLQAPTERLECKHKMCALCCQELQENGTITCPFCKKKGPWNQVEIPAGAGFRVLTIDGGGARGIVSAVILAKVEEQIEIPIHQLFDLVVGTSVGGINALAFGKFKMKGEAVLDFLQEFNRKAFIRRNMSRSFYGCKYHSQPRLDFLADKFDEPMFGGSAQLPRIAVVACDKRNGTLQKSLFTSYNCIAAISTVTREAKFSTSQAAASMGADIFFPMYGSFVCNNPCVLGYEEAKCLWEGKSLDFLLSVGTGSWDAALNIESVSRRDRAIYTQLVLDSNKNWQDLQAIDDASSTYQKSCRLNPYIVQYYKLDDITSTSALIQQTRECPNLINYTCNALLAKLFYLVPLRSPASEVSLLALRARVKVPQLEKLQISVSKAFSVAVSIDGVYDRNMQASIKEAEPDTVAQIEITGIPEQGNVTVDVLCHIAYNASFITEKPISISGCPLRIIREYQ